MFSRKHEINYFFLLSSTSFFSHLTALYLESNFVNRRKFILGATFPGTNPLTCQTSLATAMSLKKKPVSVVIMGAGFEWLSGAQ
jgi:hypothetical protein